MNVKLMRMRSGEDVVADLIEESDTTVTVANPIVAIPNGQGTLGVCVLGHLCSLVVTLQ